MKFRLIIFILGFLICSEVTGQTKLTMMDMFNNVPINSSFNDISKTIINSNYYDLLDSSNYSTLFSELVQRFSLKTQHCPSNVDSAFLFLYNGIRPSKMRRSKYHKPIRISSIQIMCYFNNSTSLDSLFSKTWSNFKSNSFHIGLLQLGVDSSNGCYIEEQKFNRKGLRNSELELTKSGIGEKYIRIDYRRDD